MPRPIPPPTPGSSSDIRGKDGAHAAPAFTLPPSGFQDSDRASASSSPLSINGSDSSYRPISPSDAPRKRSTNDSGQVITKDDFTLPPPPTRSRKIIQMKPREGEGKLQATHAESSLSPHIVGKASTVPQTSAASKRKQTNPSTTAAGRKIARKTAHSLIERRRRSKMNEEFGVLKEMIPACKGQEMHKLAILQASIDYLQYLEQCVQDLQAQSSSASSRAAPQMSSNPITVENDDDDDDDEDEEMDEHGDHERSSSTPAIAAPETTRSSISLPPFSQITMTSTSPPSLFSTGGGRHHSLSSTSQASFSPFFHSNQASPAFGPQLHHPSTVPTFSSAFGLGSPVLEPADQLRQIAESANEIAEKGNSANKQRRTEHELDQEVTTALLMLNHDRRQWRAGQRDGGERRRISGMSVRDLLSS